MSGPMFDWDLNGGSDEPSVDSLVHFAKSVTRATACGLDRVPRLAINVLDDGHGLKVTCPECLVRESAPEMLALLRRLAVGRTEMIPLGILIDEARALVARLPKEGGGG